MAIFPVSPTVGQEETVLGRTFVYDGDGWVAKDKSGHTFEDRSDTVLPTRNVAKAGAGIEFEDDAVGEKTVVRASKNLTDHIDGEDEEKHGANQIVNAAALPNIESAEAVKQSVINGNINARLFEQIAFVLSGYDIDVTTDSQDILKALPYAFKAYEIRAEFATAPTDSTATVTFYKNGVSIGVVTITDGAFSGTTVLSPVVSFAKGDSLSAVVTQIGLTVPGATAKAYVQGIKYQ